MSVQVTPSPGGEVELRFQLSADVHPGPVSVVGSFNDWTAGAHQLVDQADGSRAVTVDVPAGEDVHFRYLGSDGYWFDEPEADEITEHGSVLRVSRFGAPDSTPAPGISAAAEALADTDPPDHPIAPALGRRRRAKAS